MLTTGEITVMDEQLRVYDVDQHGWEQEGMGFDANATHVLLHLIKAKIDKNFADPEVVQTELAPDAIQYGLRLGRWADQTPSQLADAQAEPLQQFHQELVAPHTPTIGRPAMREAIATLARHLHDRGHAKTEAGALTNRPAVARTAAGLLLVCASLQADAFGFSLPDAFDARLAALRKRFGIAPPKAAAADAPKQSVVPETEA